MKVSASYVLLPVTACLAAFVQDSSGNAEKPPFSLEITAPDSPFKSGAEVVIRILFTNASDHPVNASCHILNNINMGYISDVRDARGNVLRARELKHPLEGSLRLRTLDPGESVQDRMYLDRSYDMSTPGEYVVQLSRPISGDEKDGVVKSNKITITMVP